MVEAKPGCKHAADGLRLQRMTEHRLPGDGADRPRHHAAEHGYVYVARSRRAGGLSLGIDLTPHGHCSFSCVYCQASHPPVRDPNLNIDLEVLRDELSKRLQSEELKDLVFAGSGEPTAALNFDDVVTVILLACRKFHRPRRIFTNGRHLDRPKVVEALGRWIDSGGEVWVKLDGATDATLRAVNGRTIDAKQHLKGIWNFAQQHPIGIQTMLIEGAGLPRPEDVVEEVAGAIAGQRGVRAIHLLTLAREPSDPVQAERLAAVSKERLEGLGARMRELTGLAVEVFGST
jgi:wyosine [tRNA(Phe)-imidazoG37] synthetase (radical SAM superfamily)